MIHWGQSSTAGKPTTLTLTDFYSLKFIQYQKVETEKYELRKCGLLESELREDRNLKI